MTCGVKSRMGKLLLRCLSLCSFQAGNAAPTYQWELFTQRGLSPIHYSSSFRSFTLPWAPVAYKLYTQRIHCHFAILGKPVHYKSTRRRDSKNQWEYTWFLSFVFERDQRRSICGIEDGNDGLMRCALTFAKSVAGVMPLINCGLFKSLFDNCKINGWLMY